MVTSENDPSALNQALQSMPEGARGRFLNELRHDLALFGTEITVWGKHAIATADEKRRNGDPTAPGWEAVADEVRSALRSNLSDDEA